MGLDSKQRYLRRVHSALEHHDRELCTFDEYVDALGDIHMKIHEMYRVARKEAQDFRRHLEEKRAEEAKDG